MSASEEQESLSADAEEHGSSGSAGDDQFGMLSGEGSEGDHYASDGPDSDYDEAEDEFGYISDIGDVKSYESGEEDPFSSDYDEEAEANLLSFASTRRKRAALSEEDEPPARRQPVSAPRRIVGSPKGKRPLGSVLSPVVAVPRREVKTPTARPRTTEPSPLMYEFPGDPQDAAIMLESIEAVVEKHYPDEEDNAVVARCVLFSLMFHSFYPIEMQNKISRIVNLLRD